MPSLPLRNSPLPTYFDDEDIALVIPHRWYLNNNGYVATSIFIDGKWRTRLMHRMILGLTDPKIDTDHIDRDKLNNRRSNLRAATRSQNAANQVSRAGSSRFKGVNWNKREGRWIARIGVGNRRVFLGYFDNEEDAARAYDRAAKQSFDEFARTNLPGQEGIPIPRPRQRLTAAQRDEIRALYQAGGITQDHLAARYGVTQSGISDIISERWKKRRKKGTP